MCDEFGSSMDVSGDVSTDNDVSCEESGIDFESEGVFDAPQDDIQTDISDGVGDDVYEASSLDEVEILEENGNIHTVAERMEELYGENPVEELTPAQEGLREFEESTSERLEEIREHKEALEDLKSALLAGDASALAVFGLETPDTCEDEGRQKVLTR